jgi:hypothetical protein
VLPIEPVMLAPTPLASPLTPPWTLMSADVESVTVGVPVPSMLHGDVERSNLAETPTL